MASLWIGYARTRDRASVSEALSSVSPRASISFVATPSGLREALRDEEPYTVGAIVGPCDEGVSDVNLAAALAHDGRAREVALATRDASGSLRSRALQAGITRVIDMPAEISCSSSTLSDGVMTVWIFSKTGPVCVSVYVNTSTQLSSSYST